MGGDNKTQLMSIQIGTNTIQQQCDAHMTLEKQISNTRRTSYMQIRKISSIRRYFTVDAVKTLVQATVTVRLDYCNSIYTNLPMKNIHRLQITQNPVARLLSRTPREHITLFSCNDTGFLSQRDVSSRYYL